MKLLFRKDKELYFQIYDILGFYPHNIELYQIALAHRSKMYKNHSGRAVNNERLEYLGDAVLETIVSDIVFKKFPRRREGFLTNVRSKVVQRSTLNLLAEKMGTLANSSVSIRAPQRSAITLVEMPLKPSSGRYISTEALRNATNLWTSWHSGTIHQS